VPLTHYHPRVECPFCKHRWEIPAGQLGQLGRHNARVRARQVRADDALQRATSDEEFRSKSDLAFACASATVILLATGAATWAIQRLGLTPKVAAALTLIVACCLLFGGTSASLALLDRRRSAARAAAFAPSRVRCPSCGGKQELAAGELFERCRFCGAALLPGNTIMAAAEARADQVAMQAERRQRRMERRRLVAARSQRHAALVCLAISLFLMPLVLFVGDDPPPMWQRLLGFTPALIFSSALVSRSWRVQRWKRRLAGVASRLEATRLRDLAAVGDWWDTHWIGSITDAEVNQGPCWLALAGNLGDYPVLLVLNAIGETEQFPAFLVGRVAAWSPAPYDAARTGAYAAAARVLEEQGFELRTESAGFWFRASASTLERWDPAKTADAIWVALSELCRAAREHGAAPVRSAGAAARAP
jgi:hypothetical protein